MEIDVVILSLVNRPALYTMTAGAISSLRASEPSLHFNVFVIESNPDWQQFGPLYDPQVRVLVPDAPFNFNAYNNIGRKLGRADWVLFSNNDVHFHPGWATAMLEAHQHHPEFVSLCPVDPASPHQAQFEAPDQPEIVPGYLVRSTFTGWCFMVRRHIFDRVGPFDERFDYYFADDDFSMVLRRHNLRNGAVPRSRVDHLAHQTSKASGFDISDKFRAAQQVFHQKWGAQRLIAWKNRLARHILRPLNMHSTILKLYQPH